MDQNKECRRKWQLECCIDYRVKTQSHEFPLYIKLRNCHFDLNKAKILLRKPYNGETLKALWVVTLPWDQVYFCLSLFLSSFFLFGSLDDVLTHNSHKTRRANNLSQLTSHTELHNFEFVPLCFIFFSHCTHIPPFWKSNGY